MGLAGVKKRSKLSQDPNNTTWSNSTSTFGHKILSKQGWKPGDYLGAENAAHTDHYTAANASHIRVLLRQDNLGLGAQVGKGSAETFGLSMFSGLLGRLNGRSNDEVQKQQEAIRDVELRTYTAQKYGFMNFVSGGLLVGDKIEPKTKVIQPDGRSVMLDSPSASSKKRKASEVADQDRKVPLHEKKKCKPGSDGSRGTEDILDDINGTRKEKKKKKDEEKKRKLESSEGSAEDDSHTSESKTGSKLKVKEKEKEKEKRRKAERADKPSKSQVEDDENARLKEEKRARKEERRRRKEQKRREKLAKASKSQKSSQQPARASETGGTATPPILQAYGGRQAVRQRYIQQKRMASMDPQALKEIFMMQANAAA